MTADHAPLDAATFDQIGNAVYALAVAQQKPALRKAWLEQAASLPGGYAVRYVAGGVMITRIS